MMETTQDAFLGGALTVRQPKHGYRAGVDPILLAASVPAMPGQSVLELGCGVGVASLALGWRVPGVQITGIEIQPDYAELARENAVLNKIALTPITADLEHMPETVRKTSFDHVFANPPYFDRAATSMAQDAGRERAMGENTELRHWVAQAAKRVKPKGYLHFIFRADRMLDLMTDLPNALGSIVITPIVPRAGRDAVLVLVHMRKNGRAALRIESPIVMHDGATHVQDGVDYTARIAGVLRDGRPLTDWYR